MVVFLGILPSMSAQAYTIHLNTYYYYLQSALNSNMVLDVSGGSKRDGANIQLYKKNRSDAQLFKIIKDSAGYYTLVNKGSNKALDVSGGRTSDGTNVQQYRRNNSAAQQWKIYNVKGYSDGYVTIINRCGKCLDVSGGNTKNGTNIQIYSKNYTASQVFKLVPYIQTSYRTVTLGSFSTIDQWKRQMQYAEQSVIGFSRLSYNLQGNLTNYGRMITGKTVLQYQVIKVRYKQFGKTKIVKVKLPKKVKFKIHKHNIQQTVWYDFSNLTVSQSCRCGEYSQIQWEMPYPEEDFFK